VCIKYSVCDLISGRHHLLCLELRYR